MNVEIAIIITLFELIIIGWQVYLITKQVGVNRKTRVDFEELKTDIETNYRDDIKEIIEQNKKVLNAFESFLHNQN